MVVCQCPLITSIKRETKQTLEHPLTPTLTQLLPPQLNKSTEENFILHPSASTYQSSFWPSRLRAQRNMCIFVGLCPAIEILKAPLQSHWSPRRPCLDCGGSLLQGTKGQVQYNTSSWWPEKGAFTCMTSTSLHITVAWSPCTPGFPYSGLSKLLLSFSSFLNISEGWVKVWSKSSLLIFYLGYQYPSVHPHTLGTDSSSLGTEPLP